MAYNGSGTYSLYTPGNPVVSGTTIDTTWGNNTLSDIATALSTVICKDGQTTTTGSIPFAAGIKITAAQNLYLDGGSNTYIVESSADVMSFFCGGTSRFQDKGGYFQASYSGVYTATPHSHEFVKAEDNANEALLVRHSGATTNNQYGINIILNGDPNNGTNWFLNGLGNAAQRFTMMSNGGLYNYSANDVNLSDAEAKNITGNTVDHSAFVKALAYKDFSYKDGERALVGLVAQDVEAVAPELVTIFDQATGLKGVYENQLQQRINAVVVDLVKQVEALKAEVNALKGT